MCYRQCAIACFVGTCGMEYGYTVNRYKFTKACWTCDASSSVGINKMGDFSVCSADEAAASQTYPKAEETGPPQGPGIPGDAKAEANAANQMAHMAAKNALAASTHADKAAMAALAKVNTVHAQTAGAGEAMELAEAHRLALQIRANEALKTSQAAEMAHDLAAQRFNAELAKLKRQQLATDGAEAVLNGAEKYAENMQNAYTVAAAAAAKAALDASMLAGTSAGASAQLAAAKEMLAAARAAQRRAMDASKSAESAAEKASIAASIGNIPSMPDPTVPPCAPSLLQGGGADGAGKNCAPPAGGLKVSQTGANLPPAASSPEQEALSSAQQALKAADAAPLSAPPGTQAAPGSALSSAQQALKATNEYEEKEDVTAEPAVLLKPPDLAETMVTKLASKLESDPEAAGDPQNFDIAQMPDVQAQLQAQAQEKYEAAGKLVPVPGGSVANGVADDGSPIDPPMDSVAGLPMDPSQLPTVQEGLSQASFLSNLQVHAKPAAPELIALGGEGGEFFDAAFLRDA